MERTYIMLKPDCIKRGLMGEVISRIEKKGFKITDAKMMHLDEPILREHYAHRTICEACPAEIEIFVHGALCMCYSGQCEMSAVVGSRSGNRGRCAQPCRLPYSVDGGKRGYPLSLKDNCLADDLREMREMGVRCLKLEGRMKRPEYVAVISAIYARLLDEDRAPTSSERKALEAAFSRSGFTDAYWNGGRGRKMFGVRPESAKDPEELFATVRAACEKGDLRTVPVTMHCSVSAGQPVALTVSDEDGHTVTVTGDTPEAARNRAITAEEVETRLSKTGGTAYRCPSVSAAVELGLSLPARAINALRRSGLDALEAARTAVPERREQFPIPNLPETTYTCSNPPAWTVSLSRLDQLTEALLVCGPSRIDLPLEQLPDHPLDTGDALLCAILPRVWRDRDEPRLKAMLERARENGVRGVLIGNLGHLSLVRGMGFQLFGDYGLNVFNSHSLAYLKEKGLDGACVSFELRFAQIRDLKKVLPTEAIVYGRLPLMITENCLVQNALGCKRDREDPLKVPVNGPCAGGHVLTDRTGAEFPLMGVFGHRTEIQNSRVLWLADKADWRRLGLTYARLRFTTETPAECAEVFRRYLAQEKAPGAFTRGLYERGVE